MLISAFFLAKNTTFRFKRLLGMVVGVSVFSLVIGVTFIFINNAAQVVISILIFVSIKASPSNLIKPSTSSPASLCRFISFMIIPI